MIRIRYISLGSYATNCYILTDDESGETAAVDCAVFDDRYRDFLDKLGVKELKYILLTHGHFDHVGALKAVSEETGATTYMNERDDMHSARTNQLRCSLPENGKYYDDGDVLELAGLTFYIMATPGHTPGGVTIRCEDALFTGDTLFRGSCGRTDLPGGDMVQQLDSLKRICELPGDYEVYPGHMDSSTLERERNFNYYCRVAMHGNY